MGRANHYRDLGPLGALMAASETLEQALLVLLRYRELMLPYLALALRRGEHQCTLTVSGGEALAVTHTRAHNDLLLATLVALGHSLLGGRMPIQRVAFRHPCPPDEELDEYRSFFRCALQFDQPANALVFSPALLGHSLPAADTARRRDLERTADEKLQALRRVGGVTGQVIEQLHAGLGERPPERDRSARIALHPAVDARLDIARRGAGDGAGAEEEEGRRRAGEKGIAHVRLQRGK